jgi:CDGSH-type Zn-finger protein/uncharacterized Fe-S cluster protein YjdI
MSEKVRSYQGQKVHITYERALCIHAAECGRGSKQMFEGGRTPWCDPDRVEAEQAVAIVERCPTGALEVAFAEGEARPDAPAENSAHVTPRGPLYLRGDLVVRDADGVELRRGTRLALCRCGASANKPYCDGAHEAAGFKDQGPVAADPGQEALEAGPLFVNLRRHGPLHLQGPVALHAGSGRLAQKGRNLFLCRCGQSANRPFCDGAHKAAGFEAP